jgi:aryl-alcohol dehydrogenase-like predicted oxidoreductase
VERIMRGVQPAGRSRRSPPSINVTPQQIALACRPHHTATSLPVPVTTSVAHLRENLDAASISLTTDEINAISGLASEDD